MLMRTYLAFGGKLETFVRKIRFHKAFDMDSAAICFMVFLAVR